MRPRSMTAPLGHRARMSPRSCVTMTAGMSSGVLAMSRAPPGSSRARCGVLEQDLSEAPSSILAGSPLFSSIWTVLALLE
jgi:hypothetical protein